MKIKLKVSKEELKRKLGIEEPKKIVIPSKEELVSSVLARLPELPEQIPPDTGEEIIEKINTDSGDSKIHQEKVEGLDEALGNIRRVATLPRRGGGGITAITAGRNISVASSGSARTVTNTNPKITASATAPSDPLYGDLWIDVS